MQYAELKHTEIAAQRDKVVIAPIGSLEQHGHHLPLLTDTMINAEICRRAEAELGEEALFLPVLWAGASDHHRRFPGTVSISNGVYTQVLEDILESLIGSGFKRIVLFNSHGGNGNPGHAALYNAQMRHRDERDLWLVFATWFAMAAPQIAQIDALEKQDHVTHACELETSMILRVRPELVRMDLARGANFTFESDFYTPDSSRPSRVTVARPFEHVTATGALSHPEAATAEKGERLYEVAARELVAFVRELAGWTTFEPA
ncbi:MAG: creatininase family protein [Chloroflexi bacterium]|nr:creatininase family protein [Chloroflexota bacterium]MCL5275334.1 creatininase family protein [Chloroflexota bacterium]